MADILDAAKQQDASQPSAGTTPALSDVPVAPPSPPTDASQPSSVLPSISMPEEPPPPLPTLDNTNSSPLPQTEGETLPTPIPEPSKLPNDMPTSDSTLTHDTLPPLPLTPVSETLPPLPTTPLAPAPEVTPSGQTVVPSSTPVSSGGSNTVVPPPIKKGQKKGLLIAVIFLLLVTLPIGVYFIGGSKQLAELRNKAADICEEAGGRCVPKNYFCINGGTRFNPCLDTSKKCVDAGALCSAVPTPTPTRAPTPTPTRAPTPTPTRATPTPTTPPTRTCEPTYQCTSSSLCNADNGGRQVAGTGCTGRDVCCDFERNPTPTRTPTPTPTPSQGTRCSTPNRCYRDAGSCTDDNGSPDVQRNCSDTSPVCCLFENPTPTPTRATPTPTTRPPAATATPTPRPSGQCPSSGGTVSCTPGDQNACGGAACQAQNWACTLGNNGQYFCNQHGPDLCPGGTCNKINAYHCSGDFGSQCHNGKQEGLASWDIAKTSVVKGCGQVDMVCNGGTNNNLGCGDFEVIKDSCGNTQPTPTPQPPGQCNLIKVYNAQGTDITQALVNGTANVHGGDTITLAVAGTNATKGHFRVNGAMPFMETTQTNSHNEYILPFPIPAQLPPSFTIEAEVFTQGQWR